MGKKSNEGTSFGALGYFTSGVNKIPLTGHFSRSLMEILFGNSILWCLLILDARCTRTGEECCGLLFKRKKRGARWACSVRRTNTVLKQLTQRHLHAYKHTYTRWWGINCAEREKKHRPVQRFLPCARNRQDTQPRAVSVGDEKSGAEARALPQRSGHPGGR